MNKNEMGIVVVYVFAFVPHSIKSICTNKVHMEAIETYKNNINAFANANKCESKPALARRHSPSQPASQPKNMIPSWRIRTNRLRNQRSKKGAQHKNKYTLVLITNIQNYSCNFMFIVRLAY